MKTNFPSKQAPGKVARELRKQYRIDDYEKVELNHIIDKMNIRYREQEIGPGILGACKAVGKNQLIVINPSIEYDARKRFTIAHEIGHLLMHQGRHTCNEEMLNQMSVKNLIELQANEFASELLIPKSIIIDNLKIRDTSIDLICSLSKQFNVSITSLAISFIKNTSDEVMIAYHDGKQIHWHLKSKEVKLELTHGFEMSNITNAALKCLGHAEGSVDIESWFMTDEDDIVCEEDTLYFTRLRKYLSILRLIRN